MLRRWVHVFRARRLLKRIDSGEITFNKARESENVILPPLVQSYEDLENYARYGSVFIF